MKKKLRRFYAFLLCAVLVIACVIPASAANFPEGTEIMDSSGAKTEGNETEGAGAPVDTSETEGAGTPVDTSETEGESESSAAGETGSTGESSSSGETAPVGEELGNGNVENTTEPSSTHETESTEASSDTSETEETKTAENSTETGEQNQGGDSILEQQVKAANERLMISTFSNSAASVIGTPEWPFSIASREALQDMKDKVKSGAVYEIGGQSYTYNAAAYRLDADIVLDGQTVSGISGLESGFLLDGQNHKISGMAGDSSLFVDIEQGCTIKNLVLEGTMTAMNSSAMLCSSNSGTIENCTILGSISGQYCAGIAYENYGTISNCVSSAAIEGSGPLAGIVVYQNGGTVTGCKNTGSIQGNYQAANTYRDPVGGIAAEGLGGTIESCSNLGAVSNSDGDYGHAGGIVGFSDTIVVTGCANEGPVSSAASPVGGIAGYSIETNISGSHNTGTISGRGRMCGSGGIAGTSEGGSISLCYNTGSVRGTGEGGLSGGIAGLVKSGTVIEACWNSGTMTARDAGGIAGQVGYGSDNCTVKDCYNTGAVNGDAYVGGIAGSMKSTGSIENCYNTGNLTIRGTSFTTDIGGICGTGTDAPIENCYALNESIYNENEQLGERIRRWDHSDLSGNFAWDQMLINNHVVTGGEADNEDGKDVTSSQLMDPSNTANLWSTFSAEIWSKENGKLPVLKNAGPQDSSLPQHIIDDSSKEQGVIKLEGKGTPEEPYKITTEEEWQYIAVKMNNNKSDREEFLKASYVLENDLDFSKISFVSAASSSGALAFKGHLDGQGHKISGVVWNGSNSSSPKFYGIFGYIGEEGIVENLMVEGSLTMSGGRNNMALLAGENAGTIRNCHAFGSIQMQMSNAGYGAGGIAAENNGVIEGCSADVDILLDGVSANAGGIAGMNGNTIQNCRSTGTVSSASGYAGGICGDQSEIGSKTEWCYSAACVSGKYAGGIAGCMTNGSIAGCVALGETVSGTSQEGRIAGDIKTDASFKINKAWAGMKNSKGELFDSSLPGSDENKNGGSVASEALTTAAFWKDFKYDESIWKLTDGMLPVLAGEDRQVPIPVWIARQDEEQALEGMGTPEMPYEIGDVDDLVYVMEQVQADEAYCSASYKLTGDIDLSGVQWKALGTEAKPFTGTFDGQNYQISHLTLKVNAMYQGFFGVTDGASIRNLSVQGSVTGGDFSGGLVGYAKAGTVIESCQSKIDVSASTSGGGNAGGIAAINEGTIRHCVQSGNVKGQDRAGGIAGRNAGVIEHSYSIGTLTSANIGAGGIAVQNEGDIRFCAAMQESAAISQGTGVIGKITVSNTGTLENNYAWSDMEIEGELAKDDENTGLNGKDSAITLMTGNALLFPEDYWVLTEGYYPALIGQPAANYILAHQVHNGQEMLEALDVELTKPQAQAVPETSLSGEGWTAEIKWTPEAENTFGYDTAYTAEITISTAKGYIFGEAVLATLNGEAVEAQIKDGATAVLNYTFEKTVKDIKTVELAVPEPKAQAVPETSLSGEGWTAEIKWSPEISEAFDYGTEYTATITVSPAPGYVFTENTVFLLNGAEADATEDGSGLINVVALFGKTEEKAPETSESEETADTEQTEATEETGDTSDTAQTEETDGTEDTAQTEEASGAESGQSKETSGQSESGAQNGTGNDKTDAPKTGDPTAVTFMFAVLLVSAAGICITLSRRDKNRRDSI